MTSVPLYDSFAEGYDRMTDWQSRIDSEAAFLRGLFVRYGVKSILDVACGTGQHAIAFAGWSYQVTGTDLSAPMVERARAAAGAAPVRFLVAGFGEHQRLAPGPYDAVTCLGNSLPHLAGETALDEALADFRAVLRPGGLLVIQNNNYDAILGSRRRFMGVASREEAGKEYLYFRFFDLGEPMLTFHVVTFTKSNGAWSFSEDSTPQMAQRSDALTAKVESAGFREVTVYGDCRGSGFDSAKSPNLVIAATAGP